MLGGTIAFMPLVGLLLLLRLLLPVISTERLGHKAGAYECLLLTVKIPGGYYIKHILGDQVGVCPPSTYGLDEKELFQNPYYMREQYRKAANNNETPTSDFVADNASDVPNIPDPANTPVGFSAEGSLSPQLSDEVAFGNMDFLSADFPSGDT